MSALKKNVIIITHYYYPNTHFSLWAHVHVFVFRCACMQPLNKQPDTKEIQYNEGMAVSAPKGGNVSVTLY